MPYQVTKHYGHEQGLSCCFRQWRADSHCSKLHGYALAVTLNFEADTLDNRNWVIDFGGLKAFKGWLTSMFDHTTLVAGDDPNLELYRLMEQRGIARVILVDNVGCEAFARMIFAAVEDILIADIDSGYVSLGVRLVSVTVSEHNGNHATYIGE